jgi:hypothetical protein
MQIMVFNKDTNMAKSIAYKNNMETEIKNLKFHICTSKVTFDQFQFKISFFKHGKTFLQMGPMDCICFTVNK